MAKAASKTKTAGKKRHDNAKNWGKKEFIVPELALEQFEPEPQDTFGLADATFGSTVYGWIGSGQCGGRLAKSFYDLGYRKVLAVNTSHNDLEYLKLPNRQKLLMDIGAHGAGKDMNRGREAALKYAQQMLHQLRQNFGTSPDHIMVCFGAGGGTGSGSATDIIEIAKEYMRSAGVKNPNKRVGVVMTLPTVGEASSPAVARNAMEIATSLAKKAADNQFSPFIVIDNEKVSRMYPNLTVREFWPTINSTVAELFDIFNKLSAMSSRYSSFDPVDYHSIISAGNCAIMGLTKVADHTDKFAISTAVKENLEKTMLADGFDLHTAKVAGSIVVGGQRMMANVPGLADNINYAFDILAGITGNATIHRGIYEDSREALRVYTIIGGLEPPHNRFQHILEKIAG